MQHRHRRHLLVSLAACSLAFTAASASALSRAAATLRSLRGPPPRPPPARYESAAACCSAATDALLIRRVAHATAAFNKGLLQLCRWLLIDVLVY